MAIADNHRARRLFVEKAELYLPVLEQTERTDEGLVRVTPASKVMWVVARAARDVAARNNGHTVRSKYV